MKGEDFRIQKEKTKLSNTLFFLLDNSLLLPTQRVPLVFVELLGEIPATFRKIKEWGFRMKLYPPINKSFGISIFFGTLLGGRGEGICKWR